MLLPRMAKLNSHPKLIQRQNSPTDSPKLKGKLPSYQSRENKHPNKKQFSNRQSMKAVLAPSLSLFKLLLKLLPSKEEVEAAEEEEEDTKRMKEPRFRSSCLRRPLYPRMVWVIGMSSTRDKNKLSRWRRMTVIAMLAIICQVTEIQNAHFNFYNGRYCNIRI